MSEIHRCRHQDVRDFDCLRCCLSCGLAIIEADTTANSKTAPGSKYQHRPLNHTFGQEIRLVELPPADFDDELRCNIVHTNLASQEEHDYQAVSYTWATENGSAELSQHVICGQDRLVLPISENCANVLRRVRHYALLRLVWVDMICIDQGNLGERNHQVALMSTIYSKASRVLIYLGEANANSNDVFDGIMGDSAIGSDIEVIRRFCSRRWFSRVWVIQEVAMARSALVLLGDKVLSWDRFSERLLLELNRAHPKVILTVPPPLRIGTFFYRRDHDLMSLLIATRPCKSSDPRDKMYALLALASEKDPIPLKADYTRKNDWVCTQIAAWLTEHYQDLRILRYAYRYPSVGNFSSTHSYDPLDSRLIDQEQVALDRLSTWIPYWPASIEIADILYFAGHKLVMSSRPGSSSSQPTLVTEDGHPFVHSPGPLNFVSNLGLMVLGKALGSVVIDRSQMIRSRQILSPTGWRGFFCDRRPSSNASKACCQRYQEIAEWNATDQEGQHDARKLFWSSVASMTAGLFNDLFDRDDSLEIPSAFCTNDPVGDSAVLHNNQPNTKEEESDRQIRCDDCNEQLEPLNIPAQLDFDRGLVELAGVVKACHEHFDHGYPRNGEISMYTGFATEHSLAVGPRKMRNGDSVWRLGDEPQAYVLRLEEGRYQFVGPCFLYGALQDRDCCEQERRKHWENITIW